MSNSTIIPCLQYRNAHVAIDWLCEAFGFQRLVVHADERIVHHAQLVLEGGMVMLGSACDELSTGKTSDRWQRRIVQPDQIDGRETQTSCVIVRDPDAHYAHAIAAGAEIIRDIADQEYGGRGYGCLDIEGHMWWFASYDPWQSSAARNGSVARNVN